MTSSLSVARPKFHYGLAHMNRSQGSSPWWLGLTPHCLPEGDGAHKLPPDCETLVGPQRLLPDGAAWLEDPQPLLLISNGALMVWEVVGSLQGNTWKRTQVREWHVLTDVEYSTSLIGWVIAQQSGHLSDLATSTPPRKSKYLKYWGQTNTFDVDICHLTVHPALIARIWSSIMKAGRVSSKAKNWSGKIGKRGTVLLNVFSRIQIQVKIEIKRMVKLWKLGVHLRKPKTGPAKLANLELYSLMYFLIPRSKRKRMLPEKHSLLPHCCPSVLPHRCTLGRIEV